MNIFNYTSFLCFALVITFNSIVFLAIVLMLNKKIRVLDTCISTVDNRLTMLKLEHKTRGVKSSFNKLEEYTGEYGSRDDKVDAMTTAISNWRKSGAPK